MAPQLNNASMFEQIKCFYFRLDPDNLLIEYFGQAVQVDCLDRIVDPLVGHLEHIAVVTLVRGGQAFEVLGCDRGRIDRALDFLYFLQHIAGQDSLYLNRGWTVNNMQGTLQKIRQIAEDIQYRKASFADLYAYLDQLQQPQDQSESSDEEIDMQRYIAPVRTMLGNYKHAIARIKQDQRMLTRNTEASEKQNSCPNTAKISKNRSRGAQDMSMGKMGQDMSIGKMDQDMSMRRLDEEIEHLTRKLNMK